tara:strand:+ start:1261 stop:1914 length:654 start_codon:yes stop_codon:yes gene_type:complete
MIVETYEEFSNNYHNGLIKENKLLKDELDELKYRLFSSKHEGNVKVSILQEENGKLKDELDELKKELIKTNKENEELKTFKEQAEEECSAAPVFEKMIDEIRNLEQKNEILEENINELKCDHLMKDNIIKNILLTIISNDDDDFEYKIKNDYTVAGIEIYNENVHKYYKKVVKEMNDSDWNEDNNYCSLKYDNNYNINVVFNDSSSDDSSSDDSDSY